MDAIAKKQERLQEIRDAKARWWRKISRAVTAIDKLNAEEKRLLKPRKLEPNEREGKEISAKEWYKIREQDFDDAVPFLDT